MADEVTVRTVSGQIYYIKESGGYFYVRKPSWFPGRESVGSTDTLDEALEMIEEDAGEEIDNDDK